MHYFLNNAIMSKDAHDVEPYLFVLGVAVQELLGGSLQVLLLCGAYRVFRIAKIGCGAGFNFNKNQHIPLFGHKVHLLFLPLPVAVQYFITLCLQKVFGDFFTFNASFVMFGHRKKTV